MKRNKEIIEAGIEYTLQNRPMCIGGDFFGETIREMNRNKSFEEGAKWADKTMIDKACEWLNSNFPIISTAYPWHRECFIEEFKKEMEE